jgi:hypothetical protein
MWFIPDQQAIPFVRRRGPVQISRLTAQQWWRLARGRPEIRVCGGMYVVKDRK